MSLNHTTHQVDSAKYRKSGQILHTVLGISFVVLAMKGFMIPNGFMDDGLTDISIHFHEIFHVNIGVLMAMLSILIIWLAYNRMGKTLALHIAFAVLVMSAVSASIDINPITTDKLLTTIFDSILIGAGVFLVRRSYQRSRWTSETAKPQE